MERFRQLNNQATIEDRWAVISSYTTCLLECDDEEELCTLTCMQHHLEVSSSLPQLPPKSAFF
mgnify:CR=1 FL=1